MDTQKNERYLQGIKDRDSKILQEIYNDILPGISRWVIEHGGNKEDAQDLFQEMIISIYKKMKEGNFELTCSFWTYALVVCRNLWFTKARKKDRIKYTDTINDERVEIEDNMQNEIENREQYNLYQKHFLGLEEKCQKILAMFFNKIKMAEIAEKLDTTPAYIKKRKHKCKEMLVSRIKEDALYLELKN